jgi:4-aminobutyrate aminotransferase-like enzyme/Ser/Thr protein kinase RdoA (MazF antagonist)
MAMTKGAAGAGPHRHIDQVTGRPRRRKEESSISSIEDRGNPMALREDSWDPLGTSPPNLLVEEVGEIVRRIFGVRGSLSPLPSERDQNFRVDTESGPSYVLKISNPADPPSVIEMQTEAIRHIRRQDPDLPVMRVVPTSDGASWAEVERRGGGSLLVRMFTFLPGQTPMAAELDRLQLRGFGAMVARMGMALRGFFHSAAGYEIQWDLRHTPRLRSILAVVDNPGHRAVAERVLDRFDERVAVRFEGLRAQIIHNDLTLGNVLVDVRGSINAIVDFGDLTHTALICDLAIALASLMRNRSAPFETAEEVIRGYVEVMSLEEQEAELLGDLVAARIAATGVIAAWRVRRYPENADYITARAGLAWRLLADFDQLGLTEVEHRFREACDRASLPYPPIPTSSLLERRRQVLRHAPLMYERPVHLVRGEGVWVFDAEGRRYLDAYNNVSSVGHCHPRVTDAIANQARTLNTNTRYLHEAVVALAERLVTTMPEGLDTVLFVNSGSEANDVAWRLARAATARRGAIVSEWAYHGITEAMAALTPAKWSKTERPEHVELVPAPDGYRGRYRREEETWAERYATHVGEAAARLNERGFGLAAMFVDPAFTSDGILVPPDEYFQRASLLRPAGALLIADEVQAGHGRHGSHLWSFQASGIAPDIVTMGKPMGNGHPVAAVVTRSEIAEALTRRTGLFSTFGGNPVSCAAALVVLQVIEEEGLMGRAMEVGAYLRNRLEALRETCELIGDVRGKGLLIGVDLVRDRRSREPAGREAIAVKNAMCERGVLIGSTGRNGNVLKIRPPLVFSADDADLLVRTLGEVLEPLHA